MCIGRWHYAVEPTDSRRACDLTDQIQSHCFRSRESRREKQATQVLAEGLLLMHEAGSELWSAISRGDSQTRVPTPSLWSWASSLLALFILVSIVTSVLGPSSSSPAQGLGETVKLLFKYSFFFHQGQTGRVASFLRDDQPGNLFQRQDSPPSPSLWRQESGSMHRWPGCLGTHSSKRGGASDRTQTVTFNTFCLLHFSYRKIHGSNFQYICGQRHL